MSSRETGDPTMSSAGEAATPPAAALARLTLGAALVAGAGEVVLRLLARRVQTTAISMDPNSIWLAPLSAVLLFGALVLLAWAIFRMRGARAAWLAAVTTAAFLASFDLLMLVPRLHILALAALAAGLATQVLRAARRWPIPFARVLRAAPWAFALVVSGGAASTVGWRTLSERRAAMTKIDTPSGQPNVLLLILDTVRALELSAYGYQRPTSPSLERIAREGVRFEHAVSTTPWTLPSHASLLTGLYQRDLSVGWLTPLDSVPPMLSERFASAGYATGGFIANHRYLSREYGLARGFDTYRDYAPVPTQAIGSTMVGRLVIGLYNMLGGHYVLRGRKEGRVVVNEFLGWQEAIGQRPFFAMLNFFDAHDPYAPKAPFDRMFLAEEPETRRVEDIESPSPKMVTGLQDSYDGAIASLDAQLGRLFDDLARRGVLDNTIVIVTSDHGEEFAEHGHLGHGNGLHYPALHVPLLVRWKQGGVPAGRVVTTPVSLRDVPATLLDLTRMTNPRGIPGVSLTPLWRDTNAITLSPILSELYWTPNLPPAFPVSGGNLHSLVRGRFHFIAGPASREALYDIVADPFERRDLAMEPTLSDTLVTLRAILAPMTMNDRRGR